MDETEEVLRREEIGLAHYNLDDGYGSSNSSPHSYGPQGQYCSGGQKRFGGKCQQAAQALEPEKRSLEVRLIGGTACTVVQKPERETWGRNADFLLSIIGFAVDLSNVWRFPYLCYRNGGVMYCHRALIYSMIGLSEMRLREDNFCFSAFLIPYTLMLVFGAIPLFYMELILGQYNRQGPITLWRICPLFKGVGMCAVIVAFFVSFYYNVIIGWALYYLVASLSSELPWLYCNNSWNTDSCTHFQFNWTNGTDRAEHSPASEYFRRGVLEMNRSDGLHDLGFPKWQLAICVFVVYCVLYLSLFKGVKSTGKVVWATATMPYVVLTILLIRGLMLPGAITGIKYYLQPELSKLKETQVWVDAAVQIFYSVGAGFGVHLSYASYNNFNNNCFSDCIITSAVNSFTSFFSGFVIFTYLGFMSYKQGIPISSVATEGAGLVFQVYPEAVATLPGSHFWSLLFFFMLIMLGLDSGMGGLECIITGLMDEYGGRFIGRKYVREVFTFVIVGSSFCMALVNVTPGGIYFFHLLDSYAGMSLLCSALFEAIAVSWFYGLEKFCQDVTDMLGKKPALFWRLCWKFVSPIFIIGVVIIGLVNLINEPLCYGDYAYPGWAEVIGWSVSLTAILAIPGMAAWSLFSTPGTFKERLAFSISPVDEHQMMRETQTVSRFQLRHWLYV